LDNCMYGGYKFLYLSPERLQQETVQERIRQMQVNLIAVDEAHCISQWGNDFRPAYRRCSILRDFFPQVPVLALTASATGTVVRDIIENLKLREAAVIKKSFARENIAYMVFEEADKLYKTAHILKKNRGGAIVYVTNRKATRDVSEYLNKQGIRSGFYHGGIPMEEKTTRMRRWLNGDIRVMVATNAFGMGIDKPDVRVVIHIHLPETIENYYQEAGRGGRDGKKAFAVLLKNKSDAVRVKKQFLDDFPDVDFMKLLYKKLNNYFQIAYGEGDHSTFVFNFNDFCSAYGFHPALAYNGIKLLDRNSVVSLSEAFNSKTSIRFTVGSRPLLAYLDKHPKIKTITQSILRTYGGIFDHETKINTGLISAKAATTEAAVRQALEQLQADAIIRYNAEHTDAEITFLLPREDDKTINTVAKHIEQQRRLKKRQIDAVMDYVNNDEICKSVQLLAYFGEEQAEACGICSVCIGKKTRSGNAGSHIEGAVLKELSRAPLG
ncbi:MAG: RecQ family ATP-dependent DNA helicase, partial [Sinomicrobium sp.]|nr:RecQ family ATP-dependent DNA helicase [Sinomicrobium sp.]